MVTGENMHIMLHAFVVLIRQLKFMSKLFERQRILWICGLTTVALLCSFMKTLKISGGKYIRKSLFKLLGFFEESY